MERVDLDKKTPSWCVLLIGGLSAAGKTVAAKDIGLSFGVHQYLIHTEQLVVL